MRQLTKAGCKKVFREAASGAKSDRTQLRRLLDQLDGGDVVMVTRLDHVGYPYGGPGFSKQRLPVYRSGRFA